MDVTSRTLTIIILSLLCRFSLAQSEIKISNTSIEVLNNDVHITYDIENSQESELYYVWILITDSTDQSLTINAVRGDVGYQISGGKGKKIVWDPAADSIFINQLIYIQVFAEKNRRAEDFSRRALLGQSVIFPGLGLSKTSGNFHLMKGIAGYACISGSFIYNRLAATSYQNYEKANTPQEADHLYNSAISQRRVSQILGFTAAAIWITDFVWTMAGTSGIMKTAHRQSKIKLGPDFNAFTGTPTLSLSYTF